MRWIWGALFGFAFACLVYYFTPMFYPRPNPTQQARILVEIDQLSQAVQGYREANIQFPPCLADVNPVVRKQKLMRHMQLAYPNCGYGATDLNFDALNEKIQNKWVYNFLRPDGSLGILNLDTLDPAEAIVFWLGGFPTPIDQSTKQPITTRRLCGFHRGSDNPFKRDTPAVERFKFLDYRTDTLYGFDEKRLVDNDHDGWLEYVPFPSQDGNPVAPFVYFDTAAYADSTIGIHPIGTCVFPKDPGLAGKWGTATPYAEFIAEGPRRGKWKNEARFQIICAGLDGKYGPQGDGKQMPALRVSVFGANHTFTAADGFREPREFDDTELDNLTNLSNRTLGEAAK
jgi:hypothetical protein